MRDRPGRAAASRCPFASAAFAPNFYGSGGNTMDPSSEPAAPAPRPRARNALAQVLGAEEGGEGRAREGSGTPERPPDEQGRAEQQGRRPEGQGQKRKRLSPRWRVAVIAGALAVIAGAL